MNANRSIFRFINPRLVPFFLVGFVLALTLFTVKILYFSSLKTECELPFSFYDIRKDGNVTLTRGLYRNYLDDLSSGRLTFVGTLTRFKDEQALAPPAPINREVRFSLAFRNSTATLTVTGNSRRLGDHSEDEDIRNYVFPQTENGSAATTILYLLDGKALGTGTETVPASVCIN